ncbi:hypothetical protein ACQUY5_16685 [Bacillus cereus]|uniref:hypothetical protein n=1 Tax=Bacillus cereus TaxID=1396 RepID=UPI003D18436F
MKELVGTDLENFQLGKLPWNKMFTSESDLIHDLIIINHKEYVDKGYKNHQLVKLYQNRIASGLPLSVAQVLQLKKFSREIYKYHNNM